MTVMIRATGHARLSQVMDINVGGQSRVCFCLRSRVIATTHKKKKHKHTAGCQISQTKSNLGSGENLLVGGQNKNKNLISVKELILVETWPIWQQDKRKGVYAQ